MTDIVITLLILPDGRLVFQRRDSGTAISPNGLALFGGHVEPDEAPDAAIKRELGEETSLDVSELVIRPMAEYEIIHPERDNGRFRYCLYRTEIKDADFTVFEGIRQEVYSIQEALERDDITKSARYALQKLAGD